MKIAAAERPIIRMNIGRVVPHLLRADVGNGGKGLSGSREAIMLRECLGDVTTVLTCSRGLAKFREPMTWRRTIDRSSIIVNFGEAVISCKVLMDVEVERFSEKVLQGDPQP